MKTMRPVLRCTHRSARFQGGVALILSLVVLLVLTTLSVSAMRSATLDGRIAVNHQHKQLAFQAAENALARLLVVSPAEVKIPGTLDEEPVNNADWYEAPADAARGSPPVAADIQLDLVEVSKPGQYKFSGYGLNVVTIVYRAKATGRVDGTPTRSIHRMEVALIRD